MGREIAAEELEAMITMVDMPLRLNPSGEQEPMGVGPPKVSGRRLNTAEDLKTQRHEAEFNFCSTDVGQNSIALRICRNELQKCVSTTREEPVLRQILCGG